MLHFLRSKDKVLLRAEVTVRRARRRGPFLPETWRTHKFARRQSGFYPIQIRGSS